MALGNALVTVLAITVVSTSAHTENYTVHVTRTEANLYRTDGTKFFIRTKFCYEFAFGEEAVLHYDKYSYNNSLYFVGDKQTCDVESLLSED